MAHDVFLSHTHADSTAANSICQALESNGVRCWIAPRDVRPGADWQQSIMDAIAASKVMVLIFSSHTNTSEHVKREVSVAGDANAVIIPFRIENVLPEGALRYNLNRVQWLDAYVPPLEPHIKELVRTISTVIGNGGGDTIAPVVDEEPKPVPPPIPPQPEVKPVEPPAEPAKKDPPKSVSVEVPNLAAMWASASLDRKIAVAACAVLAVVLIGFGVKSLTHRPHNESQPTSSSEPAASSAAAQAADSSASQAASDMLPASYDRHIAIYNDTGGTLEHLYSSNVQRTQWGGEDLLGSSGVIGSNSSQKINFDDGTGHCLFDIKVEFADGQTQTARKVDVCRVSTYHFTTGDRPDRHVDIANDTRSPMTHFYASNVDVANWGGEDLLGATGVVQPSNNVNINIDDGSGNCLFDFKAVFGNGETQTEASVDVCHVGGFHFIH